MTFNLAEILQRIKDDTASLDDYRSVHDASSIDYSPVRLVDSAGDPPFKDAFAGVLQQTDRQWLLQAANSSNLERSMAACRLLRFLKAPECLTALEQVWEREDLRPKDRCSLVWRVLDYEELPLQYHQKLYDWIGNNEGTFVTEFLDYLRPIMNEKRIGAVDCCDYQIKSGKQPKTKWWIYVVSAVLVAERDPSEAPAARNLLNDVSRELSQTFFPEIENTITQKLERLERTTS